MSKNEIKLRIGNPYDGDAETKTFHDATVDEAVRALRGEHGKRHGEDASDEYHEGTPVYVVRVWEETTTVEGDGPRPPTVTYDKGAPLFGEAVTVYPRGQAYDAPKGAEVSWSARGSMSPEDAGDYAALIAYAAGLANAANIGGCLKCDEQYAARRARYAKLVEDSKTAK